MSVNLHQLIGRLTRDPDFAVSASGKPYCKFTLAVDRKYKKSEADFFKCVAWNKPAEIISKYACKGTLLYVSGESQNRTWDSPDGTRKTITELIVENFELLSSNQIKTITSSKTDGIPF